MMQDARFEVYGSRMRRTMSVVKPSITTKKSIVIFGGTGYVGSAVCKAAVQNGYSVTSISRSGVPLNFEEKSWMENVNYVKGDVFKPETYKDYLTPSSAAISTIGAFGSNDTMERMNGDATVIAVKHAKESGIKTFCFVSATPSTFPEFVMRGYFNGKKRASKAVLEQFGNGGFVLQPSFVYGTRAVTKSLQLPLGIIGAPLSYILNLPILSNLQNMPVLGVLFVPPISLDCVVASLLKGVENEIKGGVYDVSKMQAMQWTGKPVEPHSSNCL